MALESTMAFAPLPAPGEDSMQKAVGKRQTKRASSAGGGRKAEDRRMKKGSGP
jgi:hypothetical protein